jgi:two-component system, NtrC family, response regulator AtoC
LLTEFPSQLFQRILGHSPAIRDVKSLLVKVAASPASTVLLCGESGTGKGLMAQELHVASARAKRRFQNITCGALPETLLESELFGHERGAFTDAKHQRKGLLETADGGTVFLDEIGEITAALQVKLLRFLEERAFKRIGGSVDIHVDVRVVAATNRDLEQAVRAREFREDLYYRLRVVAVRVPPLRERSRDIPQLAAHFIAIFNAAFAKKVRGLSPGAQARLAAHPWPGNIRELKNVLDRAVVLCRGSVLGPEHVLIDADSPQTVEVAASPAAPASPTAPAEVAPGREGRLLRLDADTERRLIVEALERAAGNQTKASELLGISRRTLINRLDEYGLQRPRKR